MFTYRPNFVPNKILIIGCGGTGSRLVPLLAQFIKTCAWVLNPEITLVDDDIVEEKNLFRQNFISPDVGRPKAEVLANRYSRAFNINISAIQERINNPNTTSILKTSSIKEVISSHNKNSIIILCVDSPQARRDILDTLLLYNVGHQNNVLLLDSGNENDFGQVSISTLCVPRTVDNSILNLLPNSIPGDIELPGVPIDFSYFTGMQETNTPSCADLDQTMAINVMMAVTIFGIIQNFYYTKPLLYHRINISLSHGSTPQYMNTDFIKKCTSINNRQFNNNYVLPTNIDKHLEIFYRDIYKPFKKAVDAAELVKKLNEIAKNLESKQTQTIESNSLVVNINSAAESEELGITSYPEMEQFEFEVEIPF